MKQEELKNSIFIGVIEDNQDPKKLGRCKCRVLNIFEEIPVEDIPWATPWKDLNGNQFFVPDIGKVVSVVFDEGNIYKPEYIYAEHYNINLEKKLDSLSGNNYTSMRALMFDHKTQIYSNDDEGLKIDYKFNNINIKDSTIDINLKDNKGRVNIGTNLADQQAILGNHFLNWFDKFLNTIVSNGHLGNLAAPLVPTPEILNVVAEYYNLRDPKFLSHHVNLADNNYINKQTRVAEGQLGDTWKSTVTNNNLARVESVDYQPIDGQSTDNPIGTLSPNPDSKNDPIAGSNPVSTTAPSTENLDIDLIFKTMQKKKYIIYEKPYQMNIIGIRRQYEGMQYSNKFIDDCYLIYKDESNSWKINKYTITTMPGFYLGEERNGLKDNNNEVVFLPPNQKFSDGKYAQPKINNKISQRFKGRSGLGMLKPSQMVDTYYFGDYHGDALKTKGPQPIYRDTTPGNIITYSVGKKETVFGGCCYFHRANSNSINVDNWSEGCQVFQNFNHWKHFMELCKIHVNKHGNSFTYTLMEERDLQNTKAEIDAEILAAQQKSAESAKNNNQSQTTTPISGITSSVAQPENIPSQPQPATETPANLTVTGDNIFDTNGRLTGAIRVFISNNGNVIKKQDYSAVNYTVSTAIDATKIEISFGVSGDDGRFYKQGEIPR